MRQPYIDQFSREDRCTDNTPVQIKTPNAQFFGSMPRSDEDAPQSVIHAPAGFDDFIGVSLQCMAYKYILTFATENRPKSTPSPE